MLSLPPSESLLPNTFTDGLLEKAQRIIMAAQQSRHKGVTPAITWASPTPSEIAANDALIDELKKQNNFESSEETQRRYSSSLTHLKRSLIASE